MNARPCLHDKNMGATRNSLKNHLKQKRCGVGVMGGCPLTA
jgi:hypothetical protein